ncbi:MAG TPA: hypothetical protein VFE16_09775 [Candidatus Cybelea sp.]|nr:hypothetical protein [Candidatus Cybelea sp.]
MEYEVAYENLRNDVAHALLEVERPTVVATVRAAAATRDLADAIHHAAGHPDDARWDAALASLEDFIEICNGSSRASRSPAVRALRAFVAENARSLRAA